MQGPLEVRVSSTMHDDNLHSENPQPYLVEKGSNVTLTCTAKGPRKPYEMDWYKNSTYLETADCTDGTQSSVETCNLILRWPDVGGKYACLAASREECAFTVLELKVAGESRVIQVSNYYYYYYHHHHHYYYYYY